MDTRPEVITANRPDTIVARFVNRASSDPERLAFTIYPMGALKALGTMKWGEWIDTARAASGGFLARHAEVGARVAIFAENRPIWPIGSMGVAMAGMVIVAIPPGGSPDVVLAQLADSAASFVIVDTLARFKMLRAMQDRLPQPITIICDDLEPLRSSEAEGVFEWESWCRYGAQALNDYPSLRERLSERLDGIRPEHASSITYAPGSNIGVVRTYETRRVDAQVLSQAFGVTYTDRITCAESASQSFHLLLGVDVATLTGATVALVEHRSDAFSAARDFDATIFVASLHEMARVREALIRAHNSGGYLRDTVCELVGRHCRMIVTNDDVCDAEFQRDLQSGGVQLATVYGSEWQTCICINGPKQFEGGAIGAALERVTVRIGEHAELQAKRSAHTAVGSYTRNDQADTAFSSDGEWHCTGDRVERSMNGSFRIVGQMKDMLEFATGRLMEAYSIETSLAALPLVAHAMCQADGVNSLVAVLSLDRRTVEEWAFTRGVVAPWDALVVHPLVYEELARGVAAVNAQHDPGERVKAFAPTDLEFSVDSGELDDFGAVVRSVVASRFRHVFAELHQHRPI